jgi:hypothetical protein
MVRLVPPSKEKVAESVNAAPARDLLVAIASGIFEPAVCRGLGVQDLRHAIDLRLRWMKTFAAVPVCRILAIRFTAAWGTSSRGRQFARFVHVSLLLQF